MLRNHLDAFSEKLERHFSSYNNVILDDFNVEMEEHQIKTFVVLMV